MPEPGQQEKTGKERRRSERKILHLPIELEGELPDGQSARGPAEVVAVSSHGALIKSRTEYRKDSTVKILNPSNNRDAEFRVVWTTPVPLEASFNIGLETDTAVPSLWETGS